MSQSAAPAEIRFAPEFDQPVRYMLRTLSLIHISHPKLLFGLRL